MANKYYVVWAGRETGIFNDWAYTKKQVDQFPGAKYKSFKTREAAAAAFADGKATPSRRVANKPTKKSSSSGKNPEVNSTFDVTLYCDGACEPNPGQSASGISVYADGQLAELWYGLYNPRGTNNSAELNALHQALLIAEKNIKLGKSVHIRCDSKYAISCITEWAFSWKKKGWKRKVAGDIKNLEVIQQAHALYVKIQDKVVVSYVKAHAGIEGNELADRMAVYGVIRQATDFCQYADSLDVPKILAFQHG